MISEATIETTLSELEAASEAFEAQIAELSHEQPELMDYLTNEDTEAFTEGEREILLFAALTIYRSVSRDAAEPVAITGDRLAAAEDANYAQLSLSKGATFRDRLTPFFEQTGQEELLAFIEDLTVAEGEDEISSEAREPFFVTLKTLVDCLT